jgi:hypothetical protein
VSSICADVAELKTKDCLAPTFEQAVVLRSQLVELPEAGLAHRLAAMFSFGGLLLERVSI